MREGFVDENRLWGLMQACDVHVNLRSPTMGETSGTAIRALALGKPLVVSDVGWFAELPSGVALKVPVDDDEVDTLVAALDLLASPRTCGRRWARQRSSSPTTSTASTVSPTSTWLRSSSQREVAASRMQCSMT